MKHGSYSGLRCDILTPFHQLSEISKLIWSQAFSLPFSSGLYFQSSIKGFWQVHRLNVQLMTLYVSRIFRYCMYHCTKNNNNVSHARFPQVTPMNCKKMRKASSCYKNGQNIYCNPRLFSLSPIPAYVVIAIPTINQQNTKKSIIHNPFFALHVPLPSPS